MSDLFDRIDRVQTRTRDEKEYTAFIQDPAKAIDEALLEMQRGLERLRLSIVSAINNQSQLRQQLQQAEAEADRWQQRVQLAKRKGLESLAEGALERQQSWLISIASLTAQVKRQSETIEALERQQVEGKNKLSQAQDKRDALIERARKVLANSQLQQLTAFERMEERVLQLETQSNLIAAQSAEAELECVHLLLNSSCEADDELRLAPSGIRYDIEDECKALEVRLLKSASQPQALPPNIITPNVVADSMVDDDLEQLKTKFDQL